MVLNITQKNVLRALVENKDKYTKEECNCTQWKLSASKN